MQDVVYHLQNPDFQPYIEVFKRTIIYSMLRHSDRIEYRFTLYFDDRRKSKILLRKFSYKAPTYQRFNEIRSEYQSEANRLADLFALEFIRKNYDVDLYTEYTNEGEMIERRSIRKRGKKIRRVAMKSLIEQIMFSHRWHYFFTFTYSPLIPTPQVVYYLRSGIIDQLDQEEKHKLPEREKYDHEEDMRRFCAQLERSGHSYRVLWITEKHKSGKPHYHGLIWSSNAKSDTDLPHGSYVHPDGIIRTAWRNIRGGRSDVQRIKNDVAAIKYVAKYISKSLAANTFEWGYNTATGDGKDRLSPSHVHLQKALEAATKGEDITLYKQAKRWLSAKQFSDLIHK